MAYFGRLPSPQVFQTFACERLPEIGKSYLRADFRIECGTPLHNKYKTYAAIMICLCESKRRLARGFNQRRQAMTRVEVVSCTGKDDYAE